MEIKERRGKRSYTLIANFVDGFAFGWKMAVPESFKEALDIKLTPRILAGKTEMTWTQGLIYNFHEGDVIYDTKLAYKEWKEALKYLKLCVQVQSVSSSGYVTDETKIDGRIVKKQRLKYGSLIFKVYRPNEEKTATKECDVIECTQDDFVDFLKTGIIHTKGNIQLNLCEKNT
jgi:hypothetical protein